MDVYYNKAALERIDREFEALSDEADPEVLERSKRNLGQLEAILGNDRAIDSLVCDILDHYENNRADLLTGKAMIVAYSRPIAMKIYRRILELRPGWTEKIAVVMTSSNQDPEEWHDVIGNKRHKEELAAKFRGRIHKRLSRVWQCEMITMAAEESVVIS